MTDAHPPEDPRTPSRPSGRHVYVLIQQTPHKAAWAIQPGEAITWEAVAVAGDDETVLLAFSSLPKALEFMQPAALVGRLRSVNKVARFRWEVVQAWPYAVMLNSSDEILDTQPVVMVQVDPNQAEKPDAATDVDVTASES